MQMMGRYRPSGQKVERIHGFLIRVSARRMGGTWCERLANKAGANKLECLECCGRVEFFDILQMKADFNAAL